MTRRPRPARQAAAGRRPNPDPTVCCCTGAWPTTIYRFHRQDLAGIVLHHHPLICGMPDTPPAEPEREPAGFAAGSCVQAERADLPVYEAEANATLRSPR